MSKIKLFLSQLLILIAICGFVSCNKESGKKDVDYIPFKLDKDDNWGMLKKDGTPLFKDEFENMPSLAYNGVFTVSSKKGVTVYTATDKPKAIKGCEDLKDAGIMSEGIIPIVKKGERIKFVDINGKEKFVLIPYKNKEIEEVSPCFYDGLAWIKLSDGKYGWVNTSGKVVVEPKYDGISAVFSDGLGIMEKEGEDKSGEEIITRYIINKSGKDIKKLPKDMEILSVYKDNRFVARTGRNEKRIVLLDRNGEIVKKFPSKVKNIIDIDSKYYIYSNDDDKCGMNDMKDETVIRAKYGIIISLKNGNYLAQKDSEKWLIIDNEDTKLKEFDDYTYMSYFNDWEIIMGYNKDNKVELLNLKGESISKEEYIISANNLSFVTSDYFNIGTVAQTIADYVSDNGIGEIQLGDNVATLMADESAYYYTNERSATIEHSKSGLKDGNKYSISLIINSNETIAERKYTYENYWGYTYQHYAGTEFNKKAKVNGLILNVLLYTSDKIKNIESLSSAVKDALAKKGFKLTKKESVSFEMEKGNNVALIFPNMSSNNQNPLLSICITTKERRKTLSSIKEIEIEYLKEKKDYKWDEGNNYPYYYSTETTTETAVEE